MQRPTHIKTLYRALALSAGCMFFIGSVDRTMAFPRYRDPVTGAGNCSECHGAFGDKTSPKGTKFPSDSKHEMHRTSTSMNTACDLCHTSGDNRNPYTYSSNGTANNTGLGCSGCHDGPGLRAHHKANGIDFCGDCHDPEPYAPAPENVKPPYYGTVDTRVDNPCNPVAVANTNENWSVGDFQGLDNDGNNVYDAADFGCGSYRVLSATEEGNNVRIAWLTAGGRTDVIQAAGSAAGTYSNVSPALSISGVGVVTTNWVEIGTATNATRFYRVKSAP
jgi:hypothetical protein